ncbi:Na+/H+ antiporter [Nocardioides sp. CF8]|uniref:Na+/H+ antiporter NhaA n=1 Tax=Nocardioides sp. CF8 TaxID=110319 RepID=UPI00032ED9F7|nr:Na+/H+ antiporter NhaA [Nocardioides sp. CF8]EON22177.1 Na+/H+ antiporter [Nocardioides sp. CF8]
MTTPLREIRRLSLETQSPLHRVESRLAPYVAFGIVPLFAFANAGLPLPSVPVSEWATDPVVLGVSLGLVLGKTLGIFSTTWLTVRLGLARYPSGMTRTRLLGVSMTAGVGFTVAIFVATLAFDDGAVIELAKLGSWSEASSPRSWATSCTVPAATGRMRPRPDPVAATSTDQGTWRGA